MKFIGSAGRMIGRVPSVSEKNNRQGHSLSVFDKDISVRHEEVVLRLVLTITCHSGPDDYALFTTLAACGPF